MLLLEKYNKEIPRYTSYPTVPFWTDNLDQELYLSEFQSRFSVCNKKEGISVYIHLPFCDSLCTYCGCNKVITTQHEAVEDPYIHAILKEWDLYLQKMKDRPLIRELHLGGGTPTYFSGPNLQKLLAGIYAKANIHPQIECSIEGHPNNTTREHLEVLRLFGFKRISFGVQDHDPKVQKIINRIQPYQQVKNVTNWAREAGFQSVNFDLIYGLPLQTIRTIEKTILDTIALKPDRIAFYSYAHIPWKARGQRLYDETDLPSPSQKLAFYALGRKLFMEAGYKDIGMDHFALPTDSLYEAAVQGRLHRNFMGYTTTNTRFLIGLGVSAISDIGSAYAQNDKKLAGYYRAIHNGDFPVQRGCLLDKTDIHFRHYILELACKGKAVIQPAHFEWVRKVAGDDLSQMTEDGLTLQNQNEIIVTDKGKMFLRNICHLLDRKARSVIAEKAGHMFSKAV